MLHSARQKRHDRSLRALRPCSVVLRYTTADSLVKAGGLYRVSEAGRLPNESEQAIHKQAYEEEVAKERARWFFIEGPTSGTDSGGEEYLYHYTHPEYPGEDASD